MAAIAEGLRSQAVAAPDTAPQTPRLHRVISGVRTASLYMSGATERMTTAGTVLLTEASRYLRGTPGTTAETSAPPHDNGAYLRNLDAPPPGVRNLIIAGGGAMAGVDSAGALTALHEERDGRRLTDNVDAYAGASVGTITLMTLLSNYDRPSIDAAEQFSHFATTDFIRSRVRPNSLSRDYLRDWLTHNVEPGRIRDSAPDFYIAVTNVDGQIELLDTRDMNDKDIYDASIASTSAPYVTSGLAEVRGEMKGDGFLMGFPIKEVLDATEDKHPDDRVNVGVFANFPIGQSEINTWERGVVDLKNLASRFPPKLRAVAYWHPQLVDRSLEHGLSDERVESAGIFAPAKGEPTVGLLSTNQEEIRAGATRGRNRTMVAIKEHLQPPTQPAPAIA